MATMPWRFWDEIYFLVRLHTRREARAAELREATMATTYSWLWFWVAVDSFIAWQQQAERIARAPRYDAVFFDGITWLDLQ